MENKRNLNRIKVMLVEKGRTNKWLSEQLGINPATVSKWCTNSSQPSLETLIRISELLEVNYTELIRIEPKPWSQKTPLQFTRNSLMALWMEHAISIWGQIPHATYMLEKPRAFDPRGQVSLTLRDKIRLTLCGQIRMTPENFAFSGVFL